MTLLDKPVLFQDPDYKKKVLLFDIETTPLITYTWGVWQQDVIEIKEEWYMLCFAYKWLGEKKTYIVALPDFKDYKKDKKNDFEVVKALHDLFNKADILIAHNGDQFDIKKANVRFLYHKLESPTPYKTIDTLKLARRHFKFDSNKLDNLGKHLKVGRKTPHTGKHLWLGCMDGDEKSWKLMKEYNKQDVILLEKIFLKLRGWSNSQTPNFNLLYGTNQNCPKCGSEHVQKGGFHYTANKIVQSYRCLNCGARPLGETIRTYKTLK